MNEIVPLENWFHYFGCIVGTFPDGKRKRTSLIVAREDVIIKTRSGSHYKLVLPVPTEHDFKQLDSIIRRNTES